MAFYRGDLIPSLRGNLLVATGGDEPAIMRLRFDGGSPARISIATLLENLGGVIRALVRQSRRGGLRLCER